MAELETQLEGELQILRRRVLTFNFSALLCFKKRIINAYHFIIHFESYEVSPLVLHIPHTGVWQIA